MSRPRWPDSMNPASEVPGTIQSAKFKYPDARKLVNGNSDSMTARLLAELTHLGLVAKLPQRQGYEKKVVT